MDAKRLKAPDKSKVRRALEALGSTEDLAKIRHKDLVQRIKAVVGFDVSISSIKTLANAEGITLWARTKAVDLHALAERVDDNTKDLAAMSRRYTAVVDALPKTRDLIAELHGRIRALEIGSDQPGLDVPPANNLFADVPSEPTKESAAS